MTARLARTAAVLVLVLAAGAAGMRTHRVGDLTAERSLTLTEQTRRVLDGLDHDVAVTAFLRRDEPGRVEAAALLGRYERESRRVAAEVVDPDDVPGDVARLGVDPVLGGVAVVAGDEVELAPTATEQDLTAAIARLAVDAPAELCLTTGHGEPELRAAAALLETEGFVVRVVDLLARPDVPATCTALVVAAPASPLPARAVTALREWTDDEGRLLVLADPVADVDLAAVLDPYGLALRRGIVFEGDPGSVIAGDVTAPIVRTYSSGHPVVRRLAPTYFPGAQAVVVDDAAEARVPGLVVTRLADTSGASYLETEPIAAAFDPAEDTPGPVTVAAAAERSRNDGARILRTRVVVVGDVDFATDGFVAEAGNADLLLRIVGWLTLDDELLALSSNIPADRPLRLTDARTAYARVLLAGVVPALFLLAGSIVWAVRRRR